ncbi:MAG: hypothetical protein H0U79_08220, partial [Solirubrobacterales bacterium]|nr:hypothetical protein [Solirubrobacterales bacterium]
VAADPGRTLLGRAEVVARLRRASGVGGQDGRLDYVADVGGRLRVVVLDTEAAREPGAEFSDGESAARRSSLLGAQQAWLDTRLREAGDRWVVVLSHRPLDEATLQRLTAFPRVLAALAGDTHDHAIRPVRGAGGGAPGLWQITTASLADFPQQGRMFALRVTPSGGVALDTWVVDHTGGPLAATARELAHLDAQGGRPAGSAGEPDDRNARLFRAAR